MAAESDSEADRFQNEESDRQLVLASIKSGFSSYESIDDLPGPLQTDREVVLALLSQGAGGYELEHVAEPLKSDREIVLAAMHSTKWIAFTHAPESFKRDRGFVLDAVRHCAFCWQDLEEPLRSDREILVNAIANNFCVMDLFPEGLKQSLLADRDFVISLVSHTSIVFDQVDEHLKADPEIVLSALRREDGWMLFESVHEELRSNRSFVLQAARVNGGILTYVSDIFKADREIAVTAVAQHPSAFEDVSEFFGDDREIVLLAVSKVPTMLQHAHATVQADRDVVSVAIGIDPMCLEFAAPSLTGDAEFVLRVVRACGDAVQFASKALRADREVVRAAVEQRPGSLKWALGGLSQDRTLLKLAGILQEGEQGLRSQKLVMSVRFALAEGCSEFSTQVQNKMREHPFLQQFEIYNPNAFCKGFCGPKDGFTDPEWPCRGTIETCKKLALNPEGTAPSIESCWRYSFHHHLEEALSSGGCMIQVVEHEFANHGCVHFAQDVLGKGQLIEEEMADTIGLKIFRIRSAKLATLNSDFDELLSLAVWELAEEFQSWLESSHSS